MAGLDSHRPDCACPRCRGQARTAERERAEAEQARTARDSAWMTVMGMGGPDAVMALAIQHNDPQRAYRLLAAAGLDAAGIASRHRAEAPHATQRSSSGNPWRNDPEHSPEAMAALDGVWQVVDERGRKRGGDFFSPGEAEAGRAALVRESGSGRWAVEGNPDEFKVIRAPGGAAAYRAKVAELTEARDRQARAERQQPGAMWRTRTGALVIDGTAPVIGASFGQNGQPVQRSIEHTSVPATGTET